jgi:hypothetical protein
MTRANRNRQQRALRNLSRYTKERNHRLEGEQCCPAEMWLLSEISSHRKYGFFVTRDRITTREIYNIARRLKLFPFPKWWRVREKLMKASEPVLDPWTIDPAHNKSLYYALHYGVGVKPFTMKIDGV